MHSIIFSLFCFWFFRASFFVAGFIGILYKSLDQFLFLQLKKLYQMSRILENNYYANNYNGPVTGTEKVTIKSTPDGIVTKEKSSYHNPNTGISESFKTKTKAERSRSRSNSSERRRRQMGHQNGYQQMPVNVTAPMTNYGPSYHQPQGIINPNDVYAHQKGTIKTGDNSYKVSEKMTYVDPVTGLQENAKIKHKVRGERSRSKSNGKSKTTYNHKLEDDKLVMKEKHREGGVMSNIKNKIHNLVHRN